MGGQHHRVDRLEKLSDALRKSENREGWRELVARSSVVTPRSVRLRDICKCKMSNYLLICSVVNDDVIVPSSVERNDSCVDNPDDVTKQKVRHF